jgi:hypothetical protein
MRCSRPRWAHFFSALSSGKDNDPKRAQTARSVNADESRARWLRGFANSLFFLCGLWVPGGSKRMQATEIAEIMEKNGSNPNEGAF